MNLNYKLATLCLSISFLSFSQNMPIDFSDGTDNFVPFGNSGFSFNVDPDDTNNVVGQFFNDGSDIWQGFYIDLNQSIDLDIEQTITLSFYSFDSNSHSIILKLENGENPDVEVAQSVSSSGWTNDIVFDFSNAIFSGTSNSVNAIGTYSRLTIFIDGGEALPGTYLMDDIDAATTPNGSDVLDVIYSDLVWSDEFDSDGPVNTDNWFHQTQIPAGGSWFNGEEQHYTNRIENSFVDNGFLNISAIFEGRIEDNQGFTDQGITKEYTSARLNSKFAFTYGRVDVRAKLPFGDGTWPAIWTLGKNINEDGAYWDNEGFDTTPWPACGEIDIMEHGLGATNHVSSAIHTPSSFGATINYQAYILNDVANNFHVYSVNWSPDQINFLIDDVIFYTYDPEVKDDSTWPFYEDQYLLLNVAMGGIAGGIDPNFVQSNMVIDYVRVYQNTGLSVDEEFASNLSVYPNPASTELKIRTDNNIDRVELYNSVGQLVLAKTETTKLLNIEALKTGIYILKIYSGSISTIKKVLIN